MAKYAGKIVLLLIPCLITTILLSYCLLSDSWVSIDETRLKNITELYEYEFNQSRVVAAPRVVLNAAKVKEDPSTTAALTFTSTRTSTTGKPNDDVHGADYTDEDYTEETDEAAANYLRVKRNLKGENLFRAKSKTKPLPADDEDDEHDPELDNNGDLDNEEDALTTGKSTEIIQQQQQHQEPNSVDQRIDYIYVTKLWPFVKYKSLYSECVEYHKIKVKLSLSYLTTEKKEPIVGDLHYYDNTAYFPNINDESPTTCGKKSMIYCSFTKTCKYGKSCDGVPDCEDQSDEQTCDQERVCDFKNDITGFRCDNKCWHYWNKCDLTPNCFDLSDETSSECAANRLELISVQASKNDPPQNASGSTAAEKVASTVSAAFSFINNDHMSFTLGHNKYEPVSNCFREYFNFKSAKLIKKDTLKYLSQQLADNVQETNNLNYHLQLIYSLSFMGALVFCVLALVSMLFVVCFGKLCFQCPFWFFGFFQILAWLACLSGLMTFMYQFYAGKQKSLDPNVQLPINSEISRLNIELLSVERVGLTFWFAVAATATSFLGSFMSCIICCRLPSSRHEDKEYKIMQLPTYSH